ncbi:MAG: XdhC family protein [Oscillospiraceae bacterium]|nr:XdhC family protein [Oscillospiraceae bacterium]
MEHYKEVAELIAAGVEFTVVSEYDTDSIRRRIERGAGVRCEFEVSDDGRRAGMAAFYASTPRLIVFGGGHIAIPVSSIAKLVGFDVVVYDDRPAFAHSARFPNAQVICDGFDKIAEHITLTDRDYVVIVTRGHKHDGECLRWVLSSESEPFYMGMIGSGRRVAIVRKQVADEGYDAERLARLHSPIGLKIGAITPEEIAVSILAEVIERKRSADSRGHYHGTFAVDPTLAAQLARDCESCAMITIVETDGSTPREEGAQMLVYADGRTYGTIGGGCAEADVARYSRQVLSSGSGWGLFEVDMTDAAEEDGMVCGGVMTVLAERA